MKIKLTIIGEPASKANSRKLVSMPVKGTNRKRPAVVKSDKALNYERDALRQIPPACRVMLKGPVKITAVIYYASERPDLDESVILDVLQNRYKGSGEDRQLIQKGVYENDRQVREKHIYHQIDKKNPRAEITIETLSLSEQDSLFEVAA